MIGSGIMIIQVLHKVSNILNFVWSGPGFVGKVFITHSPLRNTFGYRTLIVSGKNKLIFEIEFRTICDH